MVANSQNFPSEEYRILDRLKEFFNFSTDARFPIGIGDDAVIRQGEPGEQLVFTADTLVENVHFSFDYMTPSEVGYKAMVANLSDCAAMGAVPDSALVQIVFPAHSDLKNVEEKLIQIYTGFRRACRQWKFPIVGGDLSSGPCWMIAISLTGRKGRNERLLRRIGAKAGDAVWVTGMPGMSAAGLAAVQNWGRAEVPEEYHSLVISHVAPQAQIETGLKLANDENVHAVIDLSDGISKECYTLCYENRIGIQLSLPEKYSGSSIEKLAGMLAVDLYTWFLYGGEDYQLLFTASEDFNPLKYSENSVYLCKTGNVTEHENCVTLIDSAGHSSPVGRNSWDHFISPPE